ASQIICVTKQLKDRLWWRSDHATVMPGCVDLRLFCPRPRDEARATLRWSLTNKIVLFNAGTAPRTKRLDLAKAALQEANKLAGGIKMIVLNGDRSEEHTSELQSRGHLVCRLLLEKKKKYFSRNNEWKTTQTMRRSMKG